ncbi:20S-pre-rRNA D-site endonuclease nob1 [Coemansia sp. RSA 1933]|nr:20S-pre-rRNA D-site endonuclease nob1 [Coemansia sp. RSA 1933]
MSVAKTETPNTANPDTVATAQNTEEGQSPIVQEAQTTTTDEAKKQSNDKPVVTLVIDTNPLIKGLALDTLASNFVTIPEVYKELRSKAAKDRYTQLDYQYGIKVVEPDAESMSAVYGFAKSTGDFSTLALADLKVIALAFMLEKQANGMSNLKLTPGDNRPDISNTKLLDNAKVAKENVKEPEEVDGAAELGDQMEKMALEAADQPEATETLETEEKDTEADVLQSAACDEFEVGSDEGLDDNNNEEDANDDDGGEWQVAGKKPKKKKHLRRVDDFFNGSWITPTNVKKYKTASAMGMREMQEDSSPGQVLDVACVTSDFAMQNVILGMGIHLVTPDGVSVRSLRTWVLRCHACFQLTSDMSKQFCPSCGHSTLKRCSVSTGPDGRLNVHLKANYKYNLRGTIYSLPQAHGGPHKKKDVITRPDDKAYLRAMQYKQARDAKTGGGIGGAGSLMDPDFVPDLLLGTNGANNHKGFGVAIDARGMPMVSRNSKNPNVNRRTGNRKKKNLKI